jgi:hypothetical protein
VAAIDAPRKSSCPRQSLISLAALSAPVCAPDMIFLMIMLTPLNILKNPPQSFLLIQSIGFVCRILLYPGKAGKEFSVRVLCGLYSKSPYRSGLRRNFQIHESLAIYDLLFIFYSSDYRCFLKKGFYCRLAVYGNIKLYYLWE